MLQWQVDKYHRNGPVKEGNQEVIVRFRSHSDKEAFYRSRKQVGSPRIKIRPSLSQANKDLLNQAYKFIDKLHDDEDEEEKLENPPHFVMANVHGQIQLKMMKEHEGKIFFPISSMTDLANTISRLNHKDSDDLRFYVSDSEDEFY